MGDFGGADAAKRTRPVLDHDRLTERVLQMLADQASDLVGAGAAGEGHDDLDLPRGPGVIRGKGLRRRERQPEQAKQQSPQRPHRVLPNDLAVYTDKVLLKASR